MYNLVNCLDAHTFSLHVSTLFVLFLTTTFSIFPKHGVGFGVFENFTRNVTGGLRRPTFGQIFALGCATGYDAFCIGRWKRWI